MEIPDSLRDPALERFWAALRVQLDRGRDRRPATIRRPPLAAPAERALRSLLGRSYRSRIELDVLERELVERGIGADLDDVLTRLGHPPDPAADARRADVTRRREALLALEAAVADWKHDWAPSWMAEIVASGNLGGLDADDVTRLAADVERILAIRNADGPTIARVDMAALLYGDAHALDPGLRRTNWVRRALQHHVAGASDLDGRSLWDAAGLVSDSLSAPVLVWGLTALGDAPAVELLTVARRLSVPVHLSLRSLDGVLFVREGTAVLVAENPRVVEYAADVASPMPVIATNGNPSTAVTTLVDYLVWSGAEVRYHGDFDAAGLAICRRMFERRCTPWRMTTHDYLAAVRRAADGGVRLDRDDRPCGDTPWDPELAKAFNADRLVVHEEFVLRDLFR